MLFSAKTCHVRSVNLAEVGEENTLTESLSFRDENGFLKLVVPSRPGISGYRDLGFYSRDLGNRDENFPI